MKNKQDLLDELKSILEDEFSREVDVEQDGSLVLKESEDSDNKIKIDITNDSESGRLKLNVNVEIEDSVTSLINLPIADSIVEDFIITYDGASLANIVDSLFDFYFR